MSCCICVAQDRCLVCLAHGGPSQLPCVCVVGVMFGQVDTFFILCYSDAVIKEQVVLQ